MLQALDCAAGVSLADLLPRSRFFGSQAVHVSSCCDNPRFCRPGDLFAALVGPDADGHDFVDEAIQRGASAILAERPVAVGVPTCVVKDSRAAFGRICHALVGDPCEDLHTIGISGTHGKTVTSLLITSILESAGVNVGILNSIGYCDGRRVQSSVPREFATPELARWLASIRDHGCSHAVLETSSACLATRRMEGTLLDAAVMTNVRRKNLRLHRSVRNYRRAEQRLFSLLKPEGFAVINADDPTSKLLLAKIEHPVITFGQSSPAEITGQIMEAHHGEQRFLLTIGNESIPVRTAITGRHHVSNCLAAAAVSRVLGVDVPTIARGLEAVRSIPGRMENICRGQDFPIYLDNTTTPEGLSCILQSLRSVTGGKLICVLGLHSAHDPTDRARFGRSLERLADTGIITSGHHQRKLPLDVAHDILDGYDRPAIAHLIPSRAKALHWALQQAQAGDALCILGSNDDLGNDAPASCVTDVDRELVQAELARQFKPVIYRFAA